MNFPMNNFSTEIHYKVINFPITKSLSRSPTHDEKLRGAEKKFSPTKQCFVASVRAVCARFLLLIEINKMVHLKIYEA